MKSEIWALPGIIRDKLLQKRKNLKYVERKAKMYHGFSMVLLSVMTAFSLTACGGSQAVSETGIFEPIEYGSTSPDDPDMVNHYPKGDTSRSSESFQEGDSSIRDKKQEIEDMTGAVTESSVSWEKNADSAGAAGIVLEENSEYYDAYSAFISKEKEENSDYAGYNLVDINGNGIPELLIYEGISHAAGVHVYTWIDGTGLYIGTFGEFGHILIDTEHHSIRDEFFGNGALSRTYYLITDRKAYRTGFVGSLDRYDIENEKENYIYYAYINPDPEAEEYKEEWKNDRFKILDELEPCTEEEFNKADTALSTGRYLQYSYEGAF